MPTTSTRNPGIAGLVLVTAGLCGASSCTGSVGEHTPTGGDLPGTPHTNEPGKKPPPGVAPDAPPPTVVGPDGVPRADGAGPAPLRRLTADQYVRTVRDLLGADAIRGVELGGDTEDQETKFLVSGAVSQLEVGRYRDAAARIGVNVTPQLAAIVGCTLGTGAKDACATQFVTGFGRRAYRRPLEAAEVEALVALYDRARTEMARPPLEAARVVLQAMLQAPGFLYRWEQGGATAAREGALVRLPPHHVASRLSYWLTNSMPDAELAKAADEGALTNAAQVEAHARRLVASDRFSGAIEGFHLQWIGARDVTEVTKDVSRFPAYSPELMADLAAETGRFAAAVLGPGGEGTLGALLTAAHTMGNGNVARLYGVASATGGEWKRITLDPKQRAGIYTQGAFLARKALPYAGSPVKRGHSLREGLLCDRVPLAGDIVVTPPEPTKNKQTRELYVAHLTEATCRGCHALMDPLGFAFESYDGLGVHRTTEEGRPIDASGEVALPSGATLKFQSAIDLMAELAKSEDVGRCLARQWFRYGIGRLETNDEAASLDAAYQQLARSGGKVSDLLVKLAGSKAFTYRAANTGETN